MSVNIYSNGKLNKIAGKGESTKIVNNLTETIPGKALDATQGKVLNDKIKTNSDKLDIIINEGQLGITTEAKGKEITVNDSTNAKLVSFNLHGQSEQNSYSGKNLLNHRKNNETTHGITFSVNNDGSISYSGKSDLQEGTLAIYSKTMPTSLFKTNVKYCYSIKTEALGRISVMLSKREDGAFYPNTYTEIAYISAGDNRPMTFLLTEQQKIEYPYLFVFLFSVYQDKYNQQISGTIYPQIEEGTSATSYEPYVGAKPSPSPDYPQDIITSGESYNLLENKQTTQTINGVTFTVNEDKSVYTKGTANDNISLYFSTPNLKTWWLEYDTLYILSGCPKGGSNEKYNLQIDSNYRQYIDYGDGVNLLIPSSAKDKVFGVRVVIKKGQTVDFTFYPMIRKATETRTRYMPYKKGSVEVVSGGKNLFSGKEQPERGTTINMRFPDYPPILLTSLPKKFIFTSTLYCNTNNYKDTNIRIGLIASDGQTSDVIMGNNATKDNKISKLTITREELLKHFPTAMYVEFRVRIQDGGHTENTMICDASFDDTYEPYKTPISSIIPTPDGLSGIKVTSGGNYTDENGQEWITDELVKYEDGSGKYIKRIEKIRIDSVKTKTSKNIYYTPQPSNILDFKSNAKRGIILCNYLETKSLDELWSPTKTNGIGLERENRIALGFEDYPSITSLETANNFLQEHNVEMYYALKTPQETPLSSEQMAEIEKLKTFYPTTHITNDGVCGMEMKYHVDQKNYIDGQIAIMKAQQEQNLLNTLLLMPEETQAKMIENDTNNILKEVQ